MMQIHCVLLCIISEERMDGAWCQKVAGLGVSLEIPAIFGVCAPDYVTQFKVKTMSLFALFDFLKWNFL